MPRYDVILFDADNTLFDFNRAEHNALTTVMEAHGYTLDPLTEQLYLAINRVLWHRLDLGTIGREELLQERFAIFSRVMGGHDDPVEFNRSYLSLLSQGADLLPGAEALCTELARHCTLALVTNGVASTQRGRLSRSPLEPLFKGLFISEEVGVSKPHPFIFETALKTLGVTDPTRTVMVGDNLHSDILGGINAGLDTIWYNPDHQPNSTGITPTWEVHDFDTLRALLLDDAPFSF